MYKITYNNKIGPVPMTMQGYLNEYKPSLFLTVKQEYEENFNLPITNELNKELDSPENKYYLNFSAYLILDKNNKILDFAFCEFQDLVWLFNLLKINGLEIEVADSVYEKGIEPNLNYVKGLIEVKKFN